MSENEEETRACTGVDDIDWDRIAAKLSLAFDNSVKAAEGAYWEQDKHPYYKMMKDMADALVRVSAEARAQRAPGNFKLGGKS